MRIFSSRSAGVILAAIIGGFALQVGCGGGGGGSTPPPAAPDPAITSFGAASPTIQKGGSTNLTAVFTNGTGNVTNTVGTAVGAVSTGVAKAISPAATTTYTLTVTNTDGKSVSQSTTVAVQSPDATITSPSTVAINATFDASVPVQTDTASTFLWTVTGGTPTSATTRTVTITPDFGVTSVTVACTVTNGFAATASSGNKTVTVALPVPVTTVTAPSSVAYNGSFTASVPAQPDAATFEWSAVNGDITSGAGTSTITCSPKRPTFDLASVVISCKITNTYLKTATGSIGVSITHATTPSITGFVASQTDLLQGDTTSITPTFSNGTGFVDPLVGSVTSGTPYVVTPVPGITSYYLKVVNDEGNPVFKSVTVKVRAPIAAIDAPIYVASGASFQASVPDQYNSASVVYNYAWTVTGGTIDSGNGTRSITCTATGGYGTKVSVSCVITNPFGGSGAGTRTVAIANSGDAYVWPSYSPDLNYSFASEYPNLDPATFTVRPDNLSKVAYQKTSGWWVFRRGSNPNPLVTEIAIDGLLAKLNTDFAYGRANMGWPPDKGPKRGYFSAVHLHGSNLTDNDPNTVQGGWAGGLDWKNESWGFVDLTYYPVASFDPAATAISNPTYQQGAVVHEGLHCVFADLPGSKGSAWFQEGGIVALQGLMEAHRGGTKPATTGWLDGAQFLAPHTPIECYSGWLQDGSFGGPSAEGVNQYDSAGQQICTWRKYLGGGAYGTAFPRFAGEWVSPGIIPWIMKNATGRILAGLSEGLGDVQTRRLVMEYRARQALIDYPISDVAFKAVASDWWGVAVGPEGNTASGKNLVPTLADYFMTAYAMSTVDPATSILTPNALTLPGWSGANQVPLAVAQGAASVSLDFNPIGANMTCQIAYRAEDGSAVYSAPVIGTGTCAITFPMGKAPKYGVVIAVITNTDYIYVGESTRTAKYDYRLKLGTGISGKAKIADDETKAASAANVYYKYF